MAPIIAWRCLYELVVLYSFKAELLLDLAVYLTRCGSRLAAVLAAARESGRVASSSLLYVLEASSLQMTELYE